MPTRIHDKSSAKLFRFTCTNYIGIKQSRIFLIFQSSLQLALLTVVLFATMITPSKAFYTGIERIGLDPRTFDQSFEGRCYQDDALEAGRPYKSIADEVDAALQTSAAAGLIRDLKYDDLQNASEAAQAKFDPALLVAPTAQEKAEAEVGWYIAFLAIAGAELSEAKFELTLAENRLELYRALASGEELKKRTLDGAINGALSGFVSSGGPVGAAKGALDGAVLGAAQAVITKAFMDAQGGLSHYLGEVEKKKAAVADKKAVIERVSVSYQAALVDYLAAFGVSWFAAATPAELAAVEAAETAYNKAVGDADEALAEFVTLEAIEVANTPPPCDSFEVAILLDQFCTAPDQPLVSESATDFHRQLVDSICTVAAEAVDKIRRQTQSAIGSLVSSRQSIIFNNQVNISGFLDGSTPTATGPLGSSFNLVETQNWMSLAFSGRLSSLRAETMRLEKQSQLNFVETNRYGLVPNPTSVSAAALQTSGQAKPETADLPSSELGYDVWTQIYGSRSKIGNSESSAWVGHFGGHYFVSSQFIVGALFQLDWFDESNSTLGSSADGFGWMVGPYVATKIPAQNIFLDAQAAWGRSKNHASPFNTYKDDFETERWMLSSQVTGLIEANGWEVRPALRASYFSEVQESYVDSNGLDIPSQTFSMGEARAGAKFTYPMIRSNGSVSKPHFGLHGVWNFAADNGANSQGAVLSAGDLRARLEAGITAFQDNLWALDLTGFYDGIGNGDYEAYGGKARVTVPLN